MKYITLQLAKRHLNIEDTYTDEDDYVESLIDVAEAKVAKELCMGLDELATIDGGEEIPAPLKQAMLLSLGSYYANREEVTTVQTKPLEQGVKYLISLYRDYSR